MVKKDINWINAVKAICIIFVFLRHSEGYYGCSFDEISDGLFSTFYVNAFFFVSGYLLFWKQLSEPKILESASEYVAGGGKTLFFNIVYRIVIPSIIFSIIEFVPSCLIQGREIDIVYALKKTIGGGTYWFTSALVVAELLLLLLFLTRKRGIWFYVIPCLTLGIVGLIIGHLHIFPGVWHWRQGLISLIFLVMGGIYWRFERQTERFMKWHVVLLLVMVYILMVVFLSDYNDPIISTLTIQPIGFVTSALACLLLVWICKQLPEVKPLTFIGQNSIGFYFMSGGLPIIFSLLVHKMMEESSIWVMLMIWLICLFVSYVFVTIINKWMPWLWDLRWIVR